MYSIALDKDGSVHSYLEIVNADTIMENSFCMSFQWFVVWCFVP